MPQKIWSIKQYCPDFDGLSLLNRWQPNKHADLVEKSFVVP